MNDLVEKLVTGAIGMALLLYTWLRFQNRHDDLEKRVLSIEQNLMTREELREMHEENKAQNKELREQMATNEAKRSRTEHEILDVVNQLRLKSAASEAVEHYRNTQTPR